MLRGLCFAIACLWPLLAAAQGPLPPAPVPPAAAGVFSGIDQQLQVRPPRLDAEIEVDGVLDEPVWQQAAQLTGFSRYAPVDGGPADRLTEVLVWYSPAALHFGVRAQAAAGGVQATLADRDRIGDDDHVQFFLSTFGDGRQAFVFAVNPYGVQMDGALVEGAKTGGGGFGGLVQGREEVDRSPDFVFQSRGHLEPEGYVVEVRIPFKSLRYQSGADLKWGLHVTRVSPRAGVEESWAPARRDGATFLGQAGALVGMHDLKRGLVLDVNPVATASVNGAPGPATWDYGWSRPDLGMNVRWGVTDTLTMNGTVNPDFSQVEADASQFQFDPRQALFFPDKRPFFLDGIEQFATPNNLIYTRRIVAPLAAAKLTGRVSSTTSVAYLTAVDDAATSATGHDYPVFNVLRAQRDIGAGSKLALVYTDRSDGARSNRVVGADTRLVWKGIYSLLLQGAAARTDSGERTVLAPLWQATFNRTGRRYGLRVQSRGIDPDFQAQSGFINRRGVASINIANQLTTYGPPGSFVERFTSDVVVDGSWVYDDFVSGRASQDRKLHFNQNLALRGGWRVGGSVLFETFGYDETLFRNYVIAQPSSGPGGGVSYTPYVGTKRLPNRDYVFSFTVPTRRGLTADGLILWGKDENFFEWSSADIWFVNAGATYRPTDQLRLEARYQLQSYQRRSDGSYVGISRIPRLKLEYQVSRPIFLRVIAEQNGNFVDALRDDSRTGLPVYLRDSAGGFLPASRQSTRRLRVDWLFSYQPTPGTVFFAGYGTSLQELDTRTGRQPLRRISDGLFLKMSYLFRL